jgi:hypothetical protein
MSKKYIKIPAHIPTSVIAEAVSKYFAAQSLVESTQSVVEKIAAKMNSIKTDADEVVETLGLEAFLQGKNAETISDEAAKSSYLKTVVTWLGRNANGATTTVEQLLNVLGLSDLSGDVAKFAEDVLKQEAEAAAALIPENPGSGVVLPEALPMPESQPEPEVKSESIDAVVAFFNKDKNLTEAVLRPDSATKKLAAAYFDGDVKLAKAFISREANTPMSDKAEAALDKFGFGDLVYHVAFIDKDAQSEEGVIIGDHIVKLDSSLSIDSELNKKFAKQARLSQGEIESLAWTEAQHVKDNDLGTIEKYDAEKIKADKAEAEFLGMVSRLKSSKLIGEDASADLKTVKSLVSKIEDFQATSGKKVAMVTRKELALAYEMLANQIALLNTTQGLSIAKKAE